MKRGLGPNKYKIELLYRIKTNKLSTTEIVVSLDDNEYYRIYDQKHVD